VTVERAVSWTTLLCALIAGALRFGSVESDLKHAQEELVRTQQHISNVDGRVNAADKEISDRMHALTTSIAVLTAEVRELRVQLEKTEKRR
jgi:hypothetical protein